MDIDEKVEFYLSEDGSSVKSLIRKLDRSLAEIPIYGNRGFVNGVKVGFCSDERMFGKIFRVEANIERDNIQLGPYVVKNPISMLEILDSKSYGSEIKYTIMKESGDIDPRLFLIPSRIVITDTSGFMGQKFTIMAKEDPTMHLSQGLQTK
ncbi:hypothetical protein M1567_00795 [Candidatus Marsarchaeota archaeon]|jgi:hypothetical protein|nr:hypothetical protein [Candidatus Marsarchaeota archaeon]